MLQTTKKRLIDSLIKNGYLRTPAIIEAFEEIDRSNFVPDENKSDAYKNHPLPIGEGQTISQPLTVAFMLELLEPRPGDKILDIGAGSGWSSALLAKIVGEGGRVIGIERLESLKNFAEKNISKYSFIEKGVVKIVLGDGGGGYKEEAPYDKIIAAASGERIPEIWKEQLKIGGKIVVPIKESIIVLTKKSQNKFNEKQYFGFSFVPLVTNN